MIIRDPTRRPTTSSPWRPGSACTAPTTSSAGRPGSTSHRGRPKASGLEYVARTSRRRGRRRARHRRRPQRHRDAALGRPRRRDGPGVDEVHDAADAITETVYDDGAAVELRRWFPTAGSAARSREPARDVSPRARLTLRLITPEDAAGRCSRGRRRVSWHHDYPARATTGTRRAAREGRATRDACPGPRGTSCARSTGSVVGSIGFICTMPGRTSAWRGRGRLRAGRDGAVATARDRGPGRAPARAHRPSRRPLPGRVQPREPRQPATVLREAAGSTQLRGSTEDGELVMAAASTCRRPADQ